VVLEPQHKHYSYKWYCPICDASKAVYSTYKKLEEHLMNHDRSQLVSALIVYQLVLEELEELVESLTHGKAEAP